MRSMMRLLVARVLLRGGERRATRRRLGILLWLVTLLALAVPGVALGQQATLAGTHLLGTFTTSSFVCFPTQFGYQAVGEVAPPGTFATSSAYYPGTFTQGGSASSTSFTAQFRITTAAGTVIMGTASGPTTGGCARGGSTNVLSSGGFPSATYQATITTADGRRFSDAGSAFASFVGQAPGEQNLTGQSRLSFGPSNFAEAQPLDYAALAAPTRLTISRSAVHFRMLMPAQVTMTLQRRLAGRRVGRRCIVKRPLGGPRCYRYRRVGSFRRFARRGRNRVELPRRLSPKRLRKGTYRLSARATSGGLTGPSARRIIRVR